jgi:hypothetical protein
MIDQGDMVFRTYFALFRRLSAANIASVGKQVFTDSVTPHESRNAGLISQKLAPSRLPPAP